MNSNNSMARAASIGSMARTTRDWSETRSSRVSCACINAPASVRLEQDGRPPVRFARRAGSHKGLVEQLALPRQDRTSLGRSRCDENVGRKLGLNVQRLGHERLDRRIAAEAIVRAGLNDFAEGDSGDRQADRGAGKRGSSGIV